jgi:hypothetical protein
MSGGPTGYSRVAVPTPATPRSLQYSFAALTMAAAPSTSFLFPWNGATASVGGVAVVGSLVALFTGNLNTFCVNHRNPSLAVNITYELAIEGVVQGAATIVLSSGAAGPTILVASVPITIGQRFNVTAALAAGAPVNARPVWQCPLTE